VGADPLPSSPVSLEEALAETPYSYVALPQTGHESLLPGQEHEPLSPQGSLDTGPSLAAAELRSLSETVEESAEKAVREALTRSLSGETLSPVVERVVERVVWEVVPQLAERLIREAIEKLKNAPSG
jgi:hypothetical protein